MRRTPRVQLLRWAVKARPNSVVSIRPCSETHPSETRKVKERVVRTGVKPNEF